MTLQGGLFRSDYVKLHQFKNIMKHSNKKLNQVRLTYGQSLETVT